MSTSRVPDQSGVSLLYIMLQIHHSGREPSKLCSVTLLCCHYYNCMFVTVIIAFIGAIREFLQSPHCAANRHIKQICGLSVCSAGYNLLGGLVVWNPPGELQTRVCATHFPRGALFLGRGRLDGLVVKASASRTEDPGFESRLGRDFSGSSHTSDFKIGTPVANLPGAWRYRVSTGTGQPGVSIL